MTTAEARARIEDDTQWQIAPALTAQEVDRLVARAQVADAAGLVPGATGYVGTYTAASVLLATATGWDWKAAKAVKFDVKAGSTEAKRSQVYEMCLRQAARFRAAADGWSSGIGSVRVVTALGV